MRKLFIFIILMGFFSCSIPFKRENIIESKEQVNWRVLANADVVVEGTLKIPLAKIKQIQQSGKNQYIELKVDGINYLKNRALKRKNLKIKFYTKENENTLKYKVSLDKLKRLNGQRIIAYLNIIQAGMGVKSELYLLQSPEALTNTLNKSEVIHEILGQNSFSIEKIKKYYNDEKLYSAVKLLIGKMLDKKNANQAYVDLEKLGDMATPYIIMQMNDYRELGQKSISFFNSSFNTFEGLAHYSPKKVVDLLSMVLNRIENEAFYVELANGGSKIQRENAIKAWVTWLYKTDL